jgi:hypothetical protein
MKLIERITAEVPEIKYIDQDFGQLDAFVKRPNVAFPAVFIDFQNWTYTDTQGNIQIGQGDVIIHLAMDRHGHTSNLTPDEWREIPLEYYELEHKLFTKLHGWTPESEYYGYMRRNNDRSQNGPKIRRRPITFKMSYEDHGANNVLNLEPKPAPEFSKTIVGKA